MSQADFLRNMDATLHAAFASAGMAETGTYTPPGGGAAVPVRVMVDRGVQAQGEYGVAVGPLIVVRILRADVVSPDAGGTLVIGGETFTLDRLESEDESASRWVVTT